MVYLNWNFQHTDIQISPDLTRVIYRMYREKSVLIGTENVDSFDD